MLMKLKFKTGIKAAGEHFCGFHVGSRSVNILDSASIYGCLIMPPKSIGTYLKATLSLGPWTPQSRIFISLYNDPYINLSIENYIFKNTPPESHKLFLYTNDPCVVVGRNQNPWRECNLPLMNSLNIPLVRRRSGGGTVVHDKGNINFSVMTPREEFTRDKHAQMIIDSLNNLDKICQHPPLSSKDLDNLEEVTNGAQSVIGNNESELSTFGGDLHASLESSILPPLKGPQVKLKLNERYDIVTEEGDKKVSGSAYKIERQRAYHHGTMLLNSRLDTLGALLHRDISRLGTVEGRGVASVKSPVANIGCDGDVFISTVVRAFESMYYPNEVDEDGWKVEAPVAIIGHNSTIPQSVIDDAEHMKTWDWKFGQTPEFTHRITHPETDIPVEFIVNKGHIVKSIGLSQPVAEKIENVRYNSHDLSRLLPEHIWILQAIDGFPEEKLPGIST